ncbi:hypothetical protein D3C80_1579810 [compost metagenome]
MTAPQNAEDQRQQAERQRRQGIAEQGQLRSQRFLVLHVGVMPGRGGESGAEIRQLPIQKMKLVAQSSFSYFDGAVGIDKTVAIGICFNLQLGGVCSP